MDRLLSCDERNCRLLAAQPESSDNQSKPSCVAGLATATQETSVSCSVHRALCCRCVLRVVSIKVEPDLR